MPEHWTPEEINNYSRSIKAAEKQKADLRKRKDKWMDDFIDGKKVGQYPH